MKTEALFFLSKLQTKSVLGCECVYPCIKMCHEMTGSKFYQLLVPLNNQRGSLLINATRVVGTDIDKKALMSSSAHNQLI